MLVSNSTSLDLIVLNLWSWSTAQYDSFGGCISVNCAKQKRRKALPKLRKYFYDPFTDELRHHLEVWDDTGIELMMVRAESRRSVMPTLRFSGPKERVLIASSEVSFFAQLCLTRCRGGGWANHSPKSWISAARWHKILEQFFYMLEEHGDSSPFPNS